MTPTPCLGTPAPRPAVATRAIAIAIVALASAWSAPSASAATFTFDQVLLNGPIPNWQYNYSTNSSYNSVVYSGDGVNGTLATDAFRWVGTPASPNGAPAHQSRLLSGWHQQYYYYSQLWGGDIYDPHVEVGSWTNPQSLFTFVYLDPANPPAVLQLNWMARVGGNAWDHAAYWAASAVGADAPNHHYMGPVPAAGQWLRLEVPLAAVGLTVGEGYYLDIEGMAFSLYNGRATFGASGVTNLNQSVQAPSTLYRYWYAQPPVYDMFYTANFGELGLGKWGYQLQDVTGHLESAPTGASIELSRYRSTRTGHHVYVSSDWSTRNDNPADDNPGHYPSAWVYEGVTGYVYSQQYPGTVPLYRFYHPWAGVHYYTTSLAGYAQLIQGGWIYQRIDCYILP